MNASVICQLSLAKLKINGIDMTKLRKEVTDLYLRSTRISAISLRLNESRFNNLPGSTIIKDYSISTGCMIYYRGISGAIYFLS